MPQTGKNQVQQEEGVRKRLYEEQRKARMAQKLPEKIGGIASVARDAEGGAAKTEGQAASQLAGAKAQERMSADQQAKASQKKEGAAGGTGEGGAGAAVAVGGQMATGQILQFCWVNLIPSLGLTLIYNNNHFFFRY